MQAAQSRIASDFFRSDSTEPRGCGLVSGLGDAPGNGTGDGSGNGTGRPHDFTPPTPAPAFLGPIQAARRYLERQRSAAAQAEPLAGIGYDREHPGRDRSGGSQSSGERNGRERTSGEQSSGKQDRREQDRRLERSLYAGHSIEAGLAAELCGDLDTELEADLDADLDANVDADLAADLDAADLYPAHYSLHEAGRNNGQAREHASLVESDGSEPLFRYALPHPHADGTPEPDPDRVRGAIRRLARESGADREPSKAIFSAAQPEVSAAIRSRQGHAAFSEVARRVWEAQGRAEGDTLDGAASEMPEVSGQRARGQFEVPEAAVSAVSPGPEAGSARSVPALPPSRSVPPPKAQRESASDGAALAHDACNLLSALGLYSDLLSAPGVLRPQNLRYAEELKLIAGRSQALIDRLLRAEDEATVKPHGAEPVALSSGAAAGLAYGRASGAASISLHLVDAPAAPQTGIHLAWGGEAQAAGAEESFDEAQATSLVDLLLRWGSLLSTLAHGTLDVEFGADAATPVPVAAEPLERILVNLVKNARAATISGGAIRIAVASREEPCPETAEDDAASAPASPARHEVVLTVDDSGCGMTQTQVGRILGTAPQGAAETISDGYGRWLDGTVEKGEAHARSLEPIAFASEPGDGRPERRRGIGLQIVKDLVAASGGRLAIQSRPGRGTRIEIGWPVKNAVSNAAGAAETGRPSGKSGPPPPASIPAATQPVSTSLPGSAAAAQSVQPTQPVPGAIGPDGFSEQDLRAMMLRLHRAGPPGPAGSSRPQNGSGPERAGIRRAEEPNFSAVKGAIAC